MAAGGNARTTTARQDLLILFTGAADLASPVVGWSRYEGSTDRPPPHGLEEEPPYPSVLAAMRDGWRVIQLPMHLPPNKDDPYTAAHLRHEYVLEKLLEVSTDG